MLNPDSQNCLLQVFEFATKRSSKYPLSTLSLICAGKGLFAKKDFRKGDLVVVSPVLLLPKDRIESISNSNTVLMNYCIASPASSTVMFPFAWGAVANHAPPQRANLEVELFWWNKAEESEKISTPLSELSSRLSAQLDLGYRATRDIMRGEEMLYNYGDEWQAEWIAYLARVSEWSERINKNAEIQDLQRAVGDINVGHSSYSDFMTDDADTSMPQFRHFVGGQDHLFLASWIDIDVDAGTLFSSDMKRDLGSTTPLNEAEIHQEASVVLGTSDASSPSSPSSSLSLSASMSQPQALPPHESVEPDAGAGFCAASSSICDSDTGLRADGTSCSDELSGSCPAS